MTEERKPDLDHVRDALRQRDERQRDEPDDDDRSAEQTDDREGNEEDDGE
jgi:hypothetical protein